MTVKYVIFDVGGVCYPYSLKPLNDWALENCLNKEEFRKKGGIKGFDFNPYMKGEIDFVQNSKEICEYAGITYYKGIEIAIDEKLHLGVGDFYKETIEVMNKIKKRGIKVGLLSNALPNLCDTASCLTVKELCFVSYELNCLKPERKIYQKMLDKLGVKGEEVVFVDDKEKNVIGAGELGIKGIVFDKQTIKDKIDEIFIRNFSPYCNKNR